MVGIVCYNCQRMQFWLTFDQAGKLVAQCCHCFLVAKIAEEVKAQ